MDVYMGDRNTCRSTTETNAQHVCEFQLTFIHSSPTYHPPKGIDLLVTSPPWGSQAYLALPSRHPQS